MALVRLRAVRTPRAMFPGRKVGAFDFGYEGSFLALGCDPRARLECLLEIRERVKQGVAIVVAPKSC